MRSQIRTSLIATLTAAAMSVSLAACSDNSFSPQDANGSSSGNSDVAIGGKDFGTADAETTKLGSDKADGEFPRTVHHAMGDTTIDKQPERVVVLDTGELDDVLALGIKPVGMVTTEGAHPIPSYLKDKVDGVDTVGTIKELNLEKIARLEPDLIVGSKLRADQTYGQLSDIAPTVFSIRPGYPWKENFSLVGDALGKREEAQKQLSDYHKQITELGEKVPNDQEVSLLRFMSGKIRLYGKKSLIGAILQDAGIKRPKNQDIDELAKEISMETLDEADADVIFYSSYGKPEATEEKAALESALWKNMSAVKKDNTFRVDDDVWFLGLGPIGAKMIVSQLSEHLQNTK